MPDNSSIFLSYSSDDVEFALPFAEELRSAGLQVFVDRDNIPPRRGLATSFERRP
jgi:hypothetical protein